MTAGKAHWHKPWPKTHEGTKHRAGHSAKFKRPYRRQRRTWRQILKDVDTRETSYA